MATQIRERPAAPGKNDAFIEAQLDRARKRIRLIDLGAGLLGFIAGTLAFAVVMILLDRRFVLSAGSRQFALVLYLGGAAAYLAFAVLRPLRWRVNPYYAARQLEQTLPNSRNHVINWIDLHDEKVPAVLKGSLGQRAAHDLAKTDVDDAFSSRRAIASGAATGFFAVVLVVLFLLIGPGPFRSLFGRAFAPFARSGGIATRTQVVILRPQDAVATIGNPVTIVAGVSGRVPGPRDKDAPCLLYRNEEGEPYRQRYLQPDESNREWATTMPAIDVRNGFWYKVTAGDAETPEYRVRVRAAPLVADFHVTYRHRPYVGKADHTTRDTRKIDGLRGTELLILARTNRVVKDGRLDFEGSNGTGELVKGEINPDDPQALRFRMVLDRDGQYRLRFSSSDGEAYLDPIAHPVRAKPDLAPQVRITEPGKDVEVPANGHLEVKGEATDDHGVARLTLNLKVAGGPALKPKPYLADKLGKPGFGTPRALDYRDVIDLPSLQDESGKPAEIKPGMEIEYWLEAADACDYPKPNVTASRPVYKIKVVEAKNAEQMKKDRQAAQDRQKEAEKQAGEQAKKEQQEREQQRQKEQAQEEADRQKDEAQREQNKREGKGKEPDNKPDKGQDKREEPKKGEDGKDEPKDGKDEKGGNEAGNPKDDQTQKTANDLKKKLDQKEKGKGNKPDKSEGDGKDKSEDKDKGGDPAKGEGRGAEDDKPGKGKEGEPKPGEEKADPDGKPGTARGDGGQDKKNPAGEKKDGDGTRGKPGEESTARPEGKPEAGTGLNEGKPGSDKSDLDKKPGQSKEGQAPKSRPGQEKGTGQGDPAKGAGERKPDSPPKPGDRVQQGEGRDSKTEGLPADDKPGQGKDGKKPQPPEGQGEGKEKGTKAGQGKPGDKGGKQGPGQEKPAQGKPAPNAGDPDAKPGEKKGEKPGDGRSKSPQDATLDDVNERAQDLKSPSQKKQDQARRDLQEMQQKAGDQKVRDAAKEALEKDQREQQPGQEKPAPGGKVGEKGEKKPGQEKPAPGGKGPDKGEKKPGQDGNKEGAGSGKGGKPESEPVKEGEGAGNAGKPGKSPGGKKGEGSGPGKGKGKGKGNSPGESSGDERTSGGTGGDEVKNPARKEKPEAHRASVLQLEEFRKKVDKDVLKDMKMSREQFEKFLKDYADLAKRQQKSRAEAPEVLPKPSTSGTLPTIGGKAVKRPTGKDEVRTEGKPKPPPEYRAPFNDFIERLQTPPK
jgi:hypothetical protein